MHRTAEIAIVGAGPAGAHLASKLASNGCEVVLFDPKGAWEKPCGGGVTSRALSEYPFLLEDQRYPLKLVRRITLVSPSGLRVSVNLADPFAVYSREVLNGLLLDRAVEAGARFERLAVADFVRDKEGWVVKTSGDSGLDVRDWRVRFLVGADGAASFTRRRLVGIFPMRDLAIAFGYNVEDDGRSFRDTEEVIVRFPKSFTGYLWAFPRPGVMNFGVASKLGERTSEELRRLLADFVRDHYGGDMPEPERISFFGAKIPTLDLSSWPSLRASGDGWALIGDAAGFADPITGEGIYYALKSADLLAQAILDESDRPRRHIETDTPDDRQATSCGSSSTYAGAAAIYERRWREEFGRELEHASYRLPQFYHGRFFGADMTDAMVRLAKVHRGVRHVLADALMGDQSYINLKRHLLRRAFQFF